MMDSLKGISSMATRHVLAELSARVYRRRAVVVDLESVGGVDAARRVLAGEPFDFVVLASDALDKLIVAGRVLAESKVDLLHSGVAVAVRVGEPIPNISTPEALRQTVLAAPSLAYSTGPSGVALLKLFESWGIAGQIAARLVQAPVGVPVSSLVAAGVAALGFQQLSELVGQPGIALVGRLPSPVQIVTTFSGGVCTGSHHAQEVRELFAELNPPEADAAIRRLGMEPIRF